MTDHGLTPVRPRTTPLEATILDELRELREQNRDLLARVEALEKAVGPQPANVYCDRCSTVFFDRDGSRYCHPCTVARAGGA